MLLDAMPDWQVYTKYCDEIKGLGVGAFQA